MPGLAPEEVTVAGFQRILVAPIGTDTPDDITDDPSSDWVDLGYTTEDGIAFSFGLDTDDLMTSQSLDPIRKLTTARPKTVTASLRQLNRETLALALGGGTFQDAGAGWEFEHAASSFIDERAVMVEFEDGPKKVRFWSYRTMVSEAVEFTLVNTAGLVFPLTFSVLANDPFTYKWQGNSEALGESGTGGGGPPLAATVGAVNPNTGEGGEAATITGTNFAAGLAVLFGTTPATAVVRVSATQVTCTVPAGPPETAVDVVVTNPGATAGRLVNGFTYDAEP
jgi:hypothetical protein